MLTRAEQTQRLHLDTAGRTKQELHSLPKSCLELEPPITLHVLSDNPTLVVDVFPHKQTHKLLPYFEYFFSSWCFTCSFHTLSLSLSLLVFHPRLQVTNKSLNSVSSEAFSLIKSFKFWCSQMSAACCLRMWAMLEELKALCLSHTGLVFYSIARQTQWE